MTATTSRAPGEAAVLERAAGENFSVASVLAGREAQRHLTAIYGFARLVDQLGDDVEGDRRAHLDALERDLDRVYADEEAEHPIMRRLAPSVGACGFPRAPFERLIEANRRDQEQHAYATFADLVDYCHLSADPVGELVLHVFGVATPERIALSDRVCTALQLVEHWQDVGEDFHVRGRVYLPAEDLARFGVEPGAFDGDAYRRLLAFEIDRAHAVLDEGAPLVGTLRGRARVAVAGYVGGGRAALAALAAGSPKASKPRRALHALATLARGR